MITDELQNRPCSNCGASGFTWGLVREHALPIFIPEEDRTLLERLFEPHTKKVRARHCNTCGAIQFFAREGER